ncbi:MAG TPA: OmpA family protein [Luteimonas sp.]|nr:OmpA family protein [Luteimonas sp.]
MKRLLTIALIGIACGCSQPDAPAETQREARQPSAGTTPPTAPPQSDSQPPAAQGSALTGNVSALTGDVSPLQGLVDALGGEIRDHEIYVALPADTLFDFDKADIRREAEPNLRTLAELIGKTQGAVQLKGYTDAKGEDGYNLALSKRRADAVKIWLAANGVPDNRLQSVGLGEADPVAPNQKSDGTDDPQGRAKNRRVEAIIPRG